MLQTIINMINNVRQIALVRIDDLHNVADSANNWFYVSFILYFPIKLINERTNSSADYLYIASEN
jgi:hypothetical protein